MAVLEALADVLNVTQFDKRDAATVALAAKLAQQVDAAEDPKIIGDLATRLLTVLTALGLTPASRIGINKGVSSNVTPPNEHRYLDELRERRTRQSGTENLDPPA